MPMSWSPSELLRGARETAGLSRRSLAARAEVPTSTVSRIESGQADPSFGTLSRLLAAAGARLVLSATPADDAPPTLASLASAVAAGDRLVVDWTGLRAFADWARLHPADVGLAIADPPARSGTPLDAILAGFAEMLAARAGTERPLWTRTVPLPREEWTSPGTPAMVDRARAATPEPLRRRNIVLAAGNLFREADEAVA